MKLCEKLNLFKEKGFNYNSKTGDISGTSGKTIITNSNGYIRCTTKLDRKSYQVLGHVLAWYLTYNEIPNEIDHIDRNRSNNKLNNLRLVTRQENIFNRGNVKGYFFEAKRNKWYASIKLNNKTYFLGRFNIEEDARLAYLNAKEKYHILNESEI